MKKRCLFFVFLLFTFFILFISIKHNIFFKVGNKINSIKETRKSSEEYSYRHEDLYLCDSIAPLTDERDAWYTQYHFISHAGGGIDGKSYSNSRQAWNLSYQRGNRLFDADLAFTSDKILVLRHGWNDNLEQNTSILDGKEPYIDRNGQIRHLNYTSDKMEYNTFISTKIYKKYDPMSCIDMLNFMKEHSDVYVMCDMKDDLIESYKWLVNAAIEEDLEDVLDRIVISFYEYDDLKKVNDIYPFDKAMLRQYINSPHRYADIIQFCAANDIHAVSISSCYATDEGISELVNHNIHIYVAVCDFISDMSAYHQFGIEGAVTNYLYEEDYKYISK